MAGIDELKGRMQSILTNLLRVDSTLPLDDPNRDEIKKAKSSAYNALANIDKSNLTLVQEHLNDSISTLSPICANQTTNSTSSASFTCSALSTLQEAEYQVKEGVLTGTIPSVAPGNIPKNNTAKSNNPSLPIPPSNTKSVTGAPVRAADKFGYTVASTDLLVKNINLIKDNSEPTSNTKALTTDIALSLARVVDYLRDSLNSYSKGAAGYHETTLALTNAIDDLTRARNRAAEDCPINITEPASSLCLQVPEMVIVTDSVKDLLKAVETEFASADIPPEPAGPTRPNEPPVGPAVPTANVAKETWGVKFSYGKQSGVTIVEKAWHLSLLPAMRSSIPLQGGTDTPNTMPGLGFKIIPNIAKHKIVGFQPAYQHLGIDTIAVTMVGFFTGADGALPETVHLNKSQKYYNTYTSNAKVFGLEYSLADSATLDIEKITSKFDSFRDMQSFYKFAVMDGRELLVEINMVRNTKYNYKKPYSSILDPTNEISPLRDLDSGNPKFTAVVKRIEAYHARQDRTWYVIDMEVTDAGIRSNIAINLTNDISAQIAQQSADIIAAAKASAITAQANPTLPTVTKPDIYDELLNCLKKNEQQILTGNGRSRAAPKFSYNKQTGQGWVEDKQDKILSATETFNYILDTSKTGMSEARTLIEVQKYLFTYNMQLTDAVGESVNASLKGKTVAEIKALLPGLNIAAPQPKACNQIDAFNSIVKAGSTQNRTQNVGANLTQEQAISSINQLNAGIQNVLLKKANANSLNELAAPNVLAELAKKANETQSLSVKYKYDPLDGALVGTPTNFQVAGDIATIDLVLQRNYTVVEEIFSNTKVLETVNKAVPYTYTLSRNPKNGLWVISGVKS